MATHAMKPNETLESLRRHNKHELIELVKMHLSFLIEVTSEEWERIVFYVDKELEEEENRLQDAGATKTKYFTSVSTSSANSTESCKLNSKFGPPKEKERASNIFGQPLSQDSLRQAMILVDFLNDDDNFKLEGIFRKSGTHERQQDLRFMLNNGVKVDLKANRFTPVDTSCVLKEFIQKLPQPLLTDNHFELYYELAMAIKRETPPDEVEAKNAKRLKIVQLLLHLMPELNRTFFVSLMALLNRVANARDVTKMDERSLATIFGQHILCPRNWTPKQVQKNIEIITDAMEFLLINQDKLFSGPLELAVDAKKKLRKYEPHNDSKKRQSRNSLNNLSSGDVLDGDADSIGENNNHHRHHDDDDDDLEGDENNTVITFCQRRNPQDTITDQALAELYAQVQAMPETPKKKKLIKQFNKQNGFGTPMQVTKKQSSSSKWKSLLPPILRPKT